MTNDTNPPHLLSDEDFEALEELLTSDVVPEDCMSLEMLDGFLAAVVCSPEPIAPESWLPDVWSAHGDSVSFGSASQMQRAIRLVRSYYNELLATIGAEAEGWEPFCYASAEGDTLVIGEEWIDGFAQGLELWPADWADRLPAGDAAAVSEALEAMMAPWMDEANEDADDEQRLAWLEATIEPLGGVRARWRNLGLAQPACLPVDAPAGPSPAAAGRNDPCPCGSGKKYKKCCGADR